MKFSTLYLTAAVLIAGCVSATAPADAPDDTGPIGGDHDSHGCLVGAGYSWCETEHTCVRYWELAASKGIPRDRIVNYCAGH